VAGWCDPKAEWDSFQSDPLLAGLPSIADVAQRTGTNWTACALSSTSTTTEGPIRMTDANAERAAITAAMQRLLEGTPKRSTGALSIVQLAAEADVKRWVLTHKRADLADEFRSRVAASGPIPAAYSNLEQRAREAQNANQELRAQNTQLRAQITAYARIIHELHTALANESAPCLSVVRPKPK
jgi:hypothetical protein